MNQEDQALPMVEGQAWPPPQGTSIHSINGKARISYSPDWSASQPFCTYIEGTAGAQFRTLRAAKLAMFNRGHHFAEKDDWK